MRINSISHKKNKVAKVAATFLQPKNLELILAFIILIDILISIIFKGNSN